LIGGDITFLNVYNASEGFFAAQNDPEDDGMLLFLDHGIFYEFMPIEEYGKDDPKTIGLADVELDKNYALVISTNGGLWRYLVGDTIAFTSLYPFKIKVTGRLKHFINAFGEELMIENADFAISSACKKLNVSITDYTAAPVHFDEHQIGTHEWLNEFENEPNSLEDFADELDVFLKSVNSDYEAKRFKNMAMVKPIVKIMPKGTFQAWLKKSGKLGGQHKVPRLSNTRQYIDDIIKISLYQNL
jgi:hypothetical protein